MASSVVSSTSSISRSHRSPHPVSDSLFPAHSTVPPPLETLISHLLASKRSLNSIAHLHRASAIISEARSALESSTVISARSSFLQRSLSSQLRILESVHLELSTLAEQAQTDFSVVLKELDESDGRLSRTLDGLKHTPVERTFRPNEEQQRTLLDFVDEEPVETVRESLRGSIDGLNDAMEALEMENKGFQDDLDSIRDPLSDKSPNVTESTESFKAKQPSIAALQHGMEDHAKEMAVSLESLVKHFDLCITAIRHTEGGGAAAQNITGDLPEGLDVAERGNFSEPTQSLAEDERTEMLAVLHNDAAEVEDVVTEIQDRISEMELQLDQVLSWKDQKAQTSTNVHLAFHRLSQIALKLPTYVSQAQSFLTVWNDLKRQIEDGMAGLEDLRDVYDNFLSAYDGLIVEVARRRAMQLHMEKVVKEAHSKLEQLYQQDILEREAFRQDQGDYLPSDIWPGLGDQPVRFEVARAEDGGGSIPVLDRTTVENAWRRLRGSQQLR